MIDVVTLQELSQRIAAPVDHLREWWSLGLIGRKPGEELGPEDVQCARLVQFLLRRGITLAEIAEADKEHGFLARYVDMMFPGGARPTYALADARQLVGLDGDQLLRFWQASGLSEQGELLCEADVQAFKAIKVALDAGFPEAALLQLSRVYADALGRVAEAEVRLFHFYVHERLSARRASERELWQASDAARELTAPLIEPLILYFHGKGFERALREDAVMHVREDAARLENVDVPGQLQVAIVFIDLSSFTPLTEAMGDHAAAQVLDRFSHLVREAVSRGDGRVIKQIGDAFMLVFPEPRSAVACALEIERRTAAEPQFPAVRGGVHWGRVLYREGDYLGTTVNVAARLAAQAQRHQVLVTAAVRKEADGLPNVEFVPLGRRRLKGIADELELFEVVAQADAVPRPRLVDPVCGMELDPAEVAARLSLAGQERAFCSQECLQRFVAAPERY